MSNRILFLVTIVVVLLQGPFLPPVFFEGLLVVFILSSGVSNKTILQLFLSGLIFDLVQSTQLGGTSIIFIAIGFLVNLLREAIPFHRPGFAALVSAAVVLARGMFLFSNFFLAEALVSSIIVFVFLNFFWRIARDNRLEIR